MKPVTHLPVVTTEGVLHIGTLAPETRHHRLSDSLEGHCLSVSHCPNAWRSIARLGGSLLWELSNPHGKFLDVCKIANGKALRQEIETWGLDNNYVERQSRWRAWFTDESGGWRYMLCETEQDARAETADTEDLRPDGNPVVDLTHALIGTTLLGQRTQIRKLSDRDAFDLVAMAWAEDTQPELDGVWWRETYDPSSLSAPRGGIFPNRLHRWNAHKTDYRHHCDDELGLKLNHGLLPINRPAPARVVRRKPKP